MKCMDGTGLTRLFSSQRLWLPPGMAVGNSRLGYCGCKARRGEGRESASENHLLHLVGV